MLPGSPVEIILRRDGPERLGVAVRMGELAGGARTFANSDEAVVLVERQPSKDHGIHDREDRSRRADAKRQHDEGRDRKAFG